MLALAKPTARQPRKWTVAEDQKLREEVEAQKSEGEVKDWCRIAAKLPGRTNKDCRKRWTNSVAGGLKKGQWAKSEDIQLSRGVQQYGQRWTLVAEVVGSRSADQCAKRWQQSLDPDLDRSEWRDGEDQMLIEAVQKLGRHWKDIQRQHFPGRSKNCIKNRYTVLLRRYQNQGITLPEGANTPEPGTPNARNSVYSAPDEDSLSYTGSVYEDLISSQTQVSTPDTHTSWPLEGEPFNTWSTQITARSDATDISTYPQQPNINTSSANPWTWSNASLDPTPALHPQTSASYSQALNAPISAYHSYNSSMHGIFGTTGPQSSMHTRAPTSSPRTPNSAHYDAQAMNRFMKYGTQHHPDPHYRY